jgi:predicted metal-dependent hydrolase
VKHRRVIPETISLFDDDDFRDAVTADEHVSPTVVVPPFERRPPLYELDDFTIEVKRSSKRKRTVGAQLEGGVLTITVPAWMNEDDHSHWVGVMGDRFRRKLSTERIDLADRAAKLAARLELPRPREIKWSDDMLQRWGSCTPRSGVIRISSRLAKFPDWVVDYVIVHELAHLAQADHSSAFWSLVQRYPKAERAIGYLIAKSGSDHE